MDRDTILRATDRELDVLVQQAKGDEVYRAPPDVPKGVYADQRSRWPVYPAKTATGRVVCWDVPRYHSDWRHAGSLLEEMENDGCGLLFSEGQLYLEHTKDTGVHIPGTATERIARAYCLWMLERGTPMERLTAEEIEREENVSVPIEVCVCSVCGRTTPWGPGWMWVGPYTQLRATCSDACRERHRGEGEKW